MFAIALWDRRERPALLARDRFGIKPLYYRVAGGVAVVRVGAQGARAPAGIRGEIDLDALEAYLAFNASPPR